MYRGGPLHRGSSPVVGPRSANAKLFISPSMPPRYQQLAIAADGTLIIASSDAARDPAGPNLVEAVDPATGMTRWRFTIADDPPSLPAIGPNGTVFVSAGQAYGIPRDGRGLYALDGATGTKRWFIQLTRQGISPPAVDDTGTVFVTGDAVLYAIDGAIGKERWHFAVRGGLPSTSAPAVGTDGGVFFSAGPLVLGVDGATGTKRWEFATGELGRATNHASPAIGPGGLVIVHAQDEQLFALDPSTGKPVWKVTLGKPIAGTNPGPSPPAIGPDCAVYVGGNDRNLYAFDGWSGELRWTYAAGEHLVGGPAIDDEGSVYVAGSGFHAVDGATGTPRWTLPDVLVTPNLTPTIAADGTIYHSPGRGGLYAFQP